MDKCKYVYVDGLGDDGKSNGVALWNSCKVDHDVCDKVSADSVMSCERRLKEVTRELNEKYFNREKNNV